MLWQPPVAVFVVTLAATDVIPVVSQPVLVDARRTAKAEITDIKDGVH